MPAPIQLDDMLTREQCAEWLQISVRELAEKSQGMRPVIPVFRAGNKTQRYHPRTILAKMAKENGIPLELIAASYGIQCELRPA